jgi:hypothetical protein
MRRFPLVELVAVERDQFLPAIDPVRSQVGDIRTILRVTPGIGKYHFLFPFVLRGDLGHPLKEASDDQDEKEGNQDVPRIRVESAMMDCRQLERHPRAVFPSRTDHFWAIAQSLCERSVAEALL